MDRNVPDFPLVIDDINMLVSRFEESSRLCRNKSSEFMERYGMTGDFAYKVEALLNTYALNLVIENNVLGEGDSSDEYYSRTQIDMTKAVMHDRHRFQRLVEANPGMIVYPVYDGVAFKVLINNTGLSTHSIHEETSGNDVTKILMTVPSFKDMSEISHHEIINGISGTLILPEYPMSILYPDYKVSGMTSGRILTEALNSKPPRSTDVLKFATFVVTDFEQGIFDDGPYASIPVMSQADKLNFLHRLGYPVISPNFCFNSLTRSMTQFNDYLDMLNSDENKFIIKGAMLRSTENPTGGYCEINSDNNIFDFATRYKEHIYLNGFDISSDSYTVTGKELSMNAAGESFVRLKLDRPYENNDYVEFAMSEKGYTELIKTDLFLDGYEIIPCIENDKPHIFDKMTYLRDCTNTMHDKDNFTAFKTELSSFLKCPVCGGDIFKSIVTGGQTSTVMYKCSNFTCESTFVENVLYMFGKDMLDIPTITRDIISAVKHKYPDVTVYNFLQLTSDLLQQAGIKKKIADMIEKRLSNMKAITLEKFIRLIFLRNVLNYDMAKDIASIKFKSDIKLFMQAVMGDQVKSYVYDEYGDFLRSRKDVIISLFPLFYFKVEVVKATRKGQPVFHCKTACKKGAKWFRTFLQANECLLSSKMSNDVTYVVCVPPDSTPYSWSSYNFITVDYEQAYDIAKQYKASLSRSSALDDDLPTEDDSDG